jgi:dTDP-4-dehydrorhamnose reductase
MILVFGGNGQLGQELKRLSSRQGVALIGLGRSEADIADHVSVSVALSDYKPDCVINAAAYTKVDLAEIEVDQARRANEAAPAVVASCCRKAGLPLIHISTDYVFDGRKQGPYVETDPIDPLNVYGKTKAAGEAAIRDCLKHHIIIRTSWLFGEFGQNFLKTVIRLAFQNDELRIVCDQTGNPTSTGSLADALLRIIPRLLAGDGVCGTYHFAGTGVTTWHGFASRIVAVHSSLTGRNPAVEAITSAQYPTRAQRPMNSTLDCSRFNRIFGFLAPSWTKESDAVARRLLAGNRQEAVHGA